MSDPLKNKRALVTGGSRGIGAVEEIASFVAYLAGPETAYITGANLMVDGGFAA